MEAILEVKGLRKSYGKVDVLKGIDFDIKRGEVFGLVGRNGAGKSTLIHAITGIVHKTSGAFTILGQTDDQLNRVKRQIGVMPDVSNLYEHMKGLHFLKYMAELTEDKRPKKELIELMHSVGLHGAEYRKIKDYSFGMRKKLSIAQALLGKPEFIILDEPTSGLDPESAIHIRKLVESLKKSGKTIMLTSHNLDEIDKVSDRVAILSEGVIKKLDTPRALKQEQSESAQITVITKPKLSLEAIEQLPFQMVFDHEIEEGVVLHAEKKDEVADLVAYLVQEEYKVYEIKTREKTLEEVFMDV